MTIKLLSSDFLNKLIELFQVPEALKKALENIRENNSVDSHTYQQIILSLINEISNYKLKEANEYLFNELTDHYLNKLDKNQLLIHASDLGSFQMLLKLISKGADVNEKNPATKKTPLMHASWEGHSKIVQVLLNQEALVNEQDADGNTPVHHASNPEILEMLLKNGADLTLKNSKGLTAIHTQVAKYPAEHLKVILKYASVSDLEIEDNWEGYFAFHYCHSSEQTSMLLEKGLEPLEANNNGYILERVLLHYYRERRFECFKALINWAKNQNPKKRDTIINNDDTLIWAIYENEKQYATVLLDAGANIAYEAEYNISDSGYTPLMVAIEDKNLELTRYLLKRGADSELKVYYLDDNPIPLSQYVKEKAGEEFYQKFLEAIKYGKLYRKLVKEMVPAESILPNYGVSNEYETALELANHTIQLGFKSVNQANAAKNQLLQLLDNEEEKKQKANKKNSKNFEINKKNREKVTERQSYNVSIVVEPKKTQEALSTNKNLFNSLLAECTNGKNGKKNILELKQAIDELFEKSPSAKNKFVDFLELRVNQTDFERRSIGLEDDDGNPTVINWMLLSLQRSFTNDVGAPSKFSREISSWLISHIDNSPKKELVTPKKAFITSIKPVYKNTQYYFEKFIKACKQGNTHQILAAIDIADKWIEVDKSTYQKEFRDFLAFAPSADGVSNKKLIVNDFRERFKENCYSTFVNKIVSWVSSFDVEQTQRQEKSNISTQNLQSANLSRDRHHVRRYQVPSWINLSIKINTIKGLNKKRCFIQENLSKFCKLEAQYIKAAMQPASILNNASFCGEEIFSKIIEGWENNGQLDEIFSIISKNGNSLDIIGAIQPLHKFQKEKQIIRFFEISKKKDDKALKKLVRDGWAKDIVLVFDMLDNIDPEHLKRFYEICCKENDLGLKRLAKSEKVDRSNIRFTLVNLGSIAPIAIAHFNQICQEVDAEKQQKFTSKKNTESAGNEPNQVDKDKDQQAEKDAKAFERQEDQQVQQLIASSDKKEESANEAPYSINNEATKKLREIFGIGDQQQKPEKDDASISTAATAESTVFLEATQYDQETLKKDEISDFPNPSDQEERSNPDSEIDAKPKANSKVNKLFVENKANEVVVTKMPVTGKKVLNPTEPERKGDLVEDFKQKIQTNGDLASKVGEIPYEKPKPKPFAPSLPTIQEKKERKSEKNPPHYTILKKREPKEIDIKQNNPNKSANVSKNNSPSHQNLSFADALNKRNKAPSIYDQLKASLTGNKPDSLKNNSNKAEQPNKIVEESSAPILETATQTAAAPSPNGDNNSTSIGTHSNKTESDFRSFRLSAYETFFAQRSRINTLNHELKQKTDELKKARQEKEDYASAIKKGYDKYISMLEKQTNGSIKTDQKKEEKHKIRRSASF